MPPRQVRPVELLSSLRPTWSRPAAFRAVRATLVVPGLFALTSQVVGNLQMATFAAFGGFATLVLAGFGGSRRDRLVAHLSLAVAGSALLVIGTAVNGQAALAAAVTLPVAFCVLFAGIAGPNASSGATAVLLAYVLPAASPGTISMVPARLAGWWLASAVGTVAVLTLSPRPAADRLRGTAAASAAALAEQLDAALEGTAGPEHMQASIDAKHALKAAFEGVPGRPTGLNAADQALADLFEALEWCTALVGEAVREGTDLTAVDGPDRRLFALAAGVLRDTGRLLGGAEVRPLLDDLHETARAARMAAMDGDVSGAENAVHVAFHARLVAAAAGRAAVDALVATRRLDPRAAKDEPIRWLGAPGGTESPSGRPLAWAAFGRLVTRHASIRSVWFLNSARGALALAAAVAVADLTNVQHGFWVVLGTLSVLRTSAASTGATALRALGGTTAGFFVGAGLILAIGSHTTVLWVALPLAVLVAGYAPGTAPFAVGQAAFTVTLFVLYNLLVPVGWKVGVLRVEDVAIGAAVSAAAGVLFWPRGATGVVGDDLADAFHRGGVYLVQATTWALGVRPASPDARGSAVAAGVRLDDALRALLAEQGTKRVPREQLWRLVGGAMRLRLTAQSLADLPRPGSAPDPSPRALVEEAVQLAGQYDELAARLGRTPATVARELTTMPTGEGPVASDGNAHRLWVRQHLDHVKANLVELAEPSLTVADSRALGWWR